MAIYARISEDRYGDAAGVSRQLEDQRKQAAERGAVVVGEFVDNDISAYTGKPRPRYDELLDLVRRGDVDVVSVWHTSRLWRDRLERAVGMQVGQKAKISLWAGQQIFDLSRASDRGTLDFLGSADTLESATKSERVARERQQAVEQGRPGGAVPFGWKRTYEVSANGVNGRPLRDVHHPDQAPIVAELCRRLLAGEPLRAVTDWVNTTGVPAPGSGYQLKNRGRGVQNPTGQAWGKTSVKKLALRPANCGLRRVGTGTKDERLVPVNADPIITEDEWRRVVDLVGKPGQKTSRPGGRVHLFTWGIGACGVCGSVLRVAPKGAKGSRKLVYLCDDKACVGRNEQSVDTYVTAELVKVLSDKDVAATLVDSDAADAAYAEWTRLAKRLEDLDDDFDADLITREQYHRRTARLRPLIDRAKKDAENAVPTLPLELIRHVAGPKAAERIADLSVAQKRILVEAFIEQVRIMPTRRGPGFDPKDVHISWRTPASTR